MGRETGSRLKTRCPECLAAVWLKDSIEQWDPVTCPECHTALEVVSLRPLKVDYMDEWEDDDDLYEDEDEDWR